MESREVKVAALMTAARYECTYARNAIEKAVKALSIPINVSGGVYYGQCMQKMMEQLCETDCDYAITIDGDSIFTAKHVQRLINLICQCDEIDAITGVQLRRGKADLLATIQGQSEVFWDGRPIKVTTAHFGLTVIDLAKLRTVPKPWFVAKPNEEGRWEGNKIDDDVYFWVNWQNAGMSVYVDPETRIGHLEEMIATFDEDLKPVHMYPVDWQEQYDR